MIPPQPSSTLFPYTTLFRSEVNGKERRQQLPGIEASNRRRLTPVGCCPDRKSTRLNSSHRCISYAVFCLKKKIAQCKSQAQTQPEHGTTNHYDQLYNLLLSN